MIEEGVKDADAGRLVDGEAVMRRWREEVLAAYYASDRAIRLEVVLHGRRVWHHGYGKTAIFFETD